MSELVRNPFMGRTRLLAWIGNRVVIGLLSDWKTALAAQTFVKNHLDGIGGIAPSIMPTGPRVAGPRLLSGL